MQFNMAISMDNAAFADDPTEELARILHDMSERVNAAIQGEYPIHDINGNRVGEATIN